VEGIQWFVQRSFCSNPYCAISEENVFLLPSFLLSFPPSLHHTLPSPPPHLCISLGAQLQVSHVVQNLPPLPVGASTAGHAL